jgi:phospholipid/cholesterol/gamma-HCH transport system substrate-binding protein
MNNFSFEAKVGLLVLVCGAIAVYTYFQVLNGGVQEGFDLKVRFRSVEGLAVGSQVQIAGIRVGEVKSIRLDRDTGKALVILEINEAYKNSIPEDSRVIIRTRGLLGEKYVGIEPGKPNARKLEPGQEIRLVYEPTDTEKIFETVSIVAQDLQQLTEQARKQIVEERGAQRIDNIIKNTEAISQNLREVLGANRLKVERIIDRVDTGSRRINDLLAKNDSKVNETIENVRQFSGGLESAGSRFQRLASNLDGLVKDVRQGRGTLGRLATDETLYRQANYLLSDLRRLSSSIQYGRGTVGRLINDPEMYYETRRAIRNMNKTAEDVSEATPISTMAIILGSVFR